MRDDEYRLETETRLDGAFKSLMSNSSILSNMLEPLIDDFRGKDVEYIRKCLPVVEGNRTIVKLDSEFGTMGKAPVRLDNVFEVKVPGSESIAVIIDLEGQSDNNPGYRIENRALYYASCMIQAQKGRYFENDDYDKIRKVMSIWVMMNPVMKDKNTIQTHSFSSQYLDIFRNEGNIRPLDLMEIVIINIGDSNDLPNTMMGLMNTLFSRGLTASERVKVLKDTYNIKEADVLLGNLEDISMNLEEGFHNSWKREGVQEALDSGMVVSREEFIAAKQSRMNVAVKMVKYLISKGFSIDESLEPVDEDLRDSVREKILKEEFSNDSEVCR